MAQDSRFGMWPMVKGPLWALEDRRLRVVQERVPHSSSVPGLIPHPGCLSSGVLSLRPCRPRQA